MASFEIGNFVKIRFNCPYYQELIEHDTVLMVLHGADADGEYKCCVYEDGRKCMEEIYYPHSDYMVHCSKPVDEERGIVAEECKIIYDVRDLRVGDIVLILSEEGHRSEYYLAFVIGAPSIDVIDIRTGKRQYITPANIADGCVRYVHNSFDIYKDINIY